LHIQWTLREKCRDLQKIIIPLRKIFTLGLSQSRLLKGMKMKELNLEETQCVSGGTDECVKRRYDIVPCPQSREGHIGNDLSNALGEMGSAFGLWLYEVINPEESEGATN
jgi:hypothetical protein